MLRSLVFAVGVLLLTATLGAPAARAGDGDGTPDGAKHPENALIKADIQALKAARTKLKEDRDSHDTAALKADHEALKAARKKLREDLEALRKDRKPDA
jgi:hypothetical protein